MSVLSARDDVDPVCDRDLDELRRLSIAEVVVAVFVHVIDVRA